MADTFKVDVLDVNGEAKGEAVLPAELFDREINIPLIHQVVVAQLAAARQGTHSTKTRGEVRGGGIKPWRQKGTGRARHGSRRSPIWTGGGVVHGPHPRDYSQRTPKKMVAAADVARGDAAGVVAATGLRLRGEQRLLRRGARQLDEIGHAGAATARRSRLVLADTHVSFLVLSSSRVRNPRRRRCRCSGPRRG